ncbi:MAG: hypothetical protein HZA22_13050 [Nitrospirae bacterium]|nr:hypothetical protein [Nitrospirota bacterium]
MKKNFTVNNVGKFYREDTLIDSECSRKTRAFFDRLGVELGKLALRQYDYIGLPFVDREKQIHSLIAASFDKYCDFFMCEVPVERKNGHGWADLCVGYKSCAYLIEVKHEFMSLRSGEVTESLTKQWSEADKQINDISKADEDYYKENGQGMVKCTLMFVPHYVTVNKNNPDEILLDSNHTYLMSQLKPKPNYSLLWKLHKDMTEEHEFDEGILQRFYGVSFAAKIYPMI